ncbi:outer membrane lipoprotein [Chitinimonas naiadis]
MTIQKLTQLLFFLSLALVTSCAANTRREDRYASHVSLEQRHIQYGRVSNIESVPIDSRNTGGGAALGAIVGAVIGHQIGSGSGRSVATGVGLVGGAVIGNSMEKRHDSDRAIYRVSVRTEDGRNLRFDYERIDNLQVGDKVRIQDGQLYHDDI